MDSFLQCNLWCHCIVLMRFANNNKTKPCFPYYYIHFFWRKWNGKQNKNLTTYKESLVII